MVTVAMIAMAKNPDEKTLLKVIMSMTTTMTTVLHRDLDIHLSTFPISVLRSTGYSSHARHVKIWFDKFFLRRTTSTQHWSTLVMSQVNMSGDQTVECIAGGTWIP